MSRDSCVAQRLRANRWSPLFRGQNFRKSHDEREALVRELTTKWGVSREFVLRELEQVEQGEVWLNGLYTVQIRRQPVDGDPAHNWVHLSIRRNDREAARDWRHFQNIKNQLIGPECEALELFPAESRLVDVANSWHLWGCDDPTFRFPVGWHGQGRMVSGEIDSTTGAKQRPLDEDVS